MRGPAPVSSSARTFVREGVLEASPSPVYGAALLMRFGSYHPSRVQIPPPPQFIEAPVRQDRGFDAFRSVRPAGRSGWFRALPDRCPSLVRARTDDLHPERFRRSAGVWVMDFASRRGPCIVVLARPTGRKTPGSPSTRSLTDRASDYGSEGCRFESCRVHSRTEAPDKSPGPLSCAYPVFRMPVLLPYAGLACVPDVPGGMRELLLDGEGVPRKMSGAGWLWRGTSTTRWRRYGS